MSYILLFDLPRFRKNVVVKVNRKLHGIGAKKLQHSVWESKDLSSLKEIADLIKNSGGDAFIIKKLIAYR